MWRLRRRFVFPARAGVNRTAVLATFQPPQVFPARAGVNRALRLPIHCLAWRIPRTRGGEPIRLYHFGPCFHVFPARAGVNLAGKVCGGPSIVSIPRTRGGEPSMVTFATLQDERIPRTRGGEPASCTRTPGRSRVFPARAGVNRHALSSQQRR